MTIHQAEESDFDELISVWELSVRASHHFLSEEDIQFYKKRIIGYYFYQVKLFYLEEDSKITAFMGLSEEKIEALFVHPNWFRKGLGKFLCNYAVHTLNIKFLDVSEQNFQAFEFYKSFGFEVIGRSEKDNDGKDYPLLHLKFK